MPDTIRKNRILKGHDLYLGARNTGCWVNQTDDFGMQASSYPAIYWMERHMLPLSLDSPFTPTRGRFCLDDKCLKLEDSESYQASDYLFDYTMSTFTLRRPVPCAEGLYCHPGTGVSESNMKNFSTPQPCFETMYCPEGSESPTGQGECPQGFYCPFGVKIACPVGTHCPREGQYDPLPCIPGTFNAQLAVSTHHRLQLLSIQLNNKQKILIVYVTVDLGSINSKVTSLFHSDDTLHPLPQGVYLSGVWEGGPGYLPPWIRMFQNRSQVPQPQVRDIAVWQIAL